MFNKNAHVGIILCPKSHFGPGEILVPVVGRSLRHVHVLMTYAMMNEVVVLLSLYVAVCP